MEKTVTGTETPTEGQETTTIIPTRGTPPGHHPPPLVHHVEIENRANLDRNLTNDSINSTNSKNGSLNKNVSHSIHYIQYCIFFTFTAIFVAMF